MAASQRTQVPQIMPHASHALGRQRVDCWICKETALGACRFCGRGICGDHAKFLPFILELYNARTKEHVQALIVEDALHCGVCRPRPEPIALEELD